MTRFRLLLRSILPISFAVAASLAIAAPTTGKDERFLAAARRLPGR